MTAGMKTLIIARPGNTFGPGDTPTRVGARTDLPLVESGKAQAKALGLHFLENGLVPDVVYVSPLLRTQHTADIILQATNTEAAIETLELLREIDYGPDENRPEEAVIARIGKEAIKLWDERAIVPKGWLVDPDKLIRGWLDFSQSIEKSEKNTFLAVTSNGAARFAPHITGDFEGFRTGFPLKLRTGAYGILQFDGDRWFAAGWDIRPENPS